MQKKLKIAIVTNNYKPYSGGVVSSIDSFVKELNNLGHEVFIITLDFLGKKYPDENNVFRINCPIRFNYKKNPIAVPWYPDSAILSLIKDLNPDIIHSQHPFLLGKSALNASKILNIPLIFTYHTQYEKYSHYVPLVPGVLTEPIIKKVVKDYCKNVEGIIAPSNSILNLLLNNEINKPIKVISSGILPIFSKSNFNYVRNNPFQILTVSRFTKEKNIPFLLDVFATLDQNLFDFTLIGYGAYLTYLKNYSYNTLGLSEKKVKFIEKPSKDIIAKFYKKSDLFIFSSVTETQGLVLAEAMAGGTPVIAVDAPGSNDIVKNGVNGFLVKSRDEMNQQINFLKNDIELHKIMQKNAWKTGNNYNCVNMTKNLVDFYYEILVN